MNEEYLKQIDELLAQGKADHEIFSEIILADDFTGSQASVIESINLKKKERSGETEETDSGLDSEDQSTPPEQPAISDLDPEDSGSSLQADQLELVNKAESEIGEDYAFWLKNTLGTDKEKELVYNVPSFLTKSYLDIDDPVQKEAYRVSYTPVSAAKMNPGLTFLHDIKRAYRESLDYFSAEEDQDYHLDMPIPPENSPAYKQWYDSLLPSMQAEVAVPKKYQDFDFTPEQEQLAEDAYSEIEKKFFEQEGLREELLDYLPRTRKDLKSQLDSGEIEKRQYLEEIEKIDNKFLGLKYQEFMENEGVGIVKNYIGEIDEDDLFSTSSDFAEAFTDKLFYEYGLDTDLDNDGVYNSKTFFGFEVGDPRSMFAGADAEMYRLATGMESLFEEGVDWISKKTMGSTPYGLYGSEEYFKKQRAYTNRRYEAEMGDASFSNKSIGDAFLDRDATALFTHVGNGVGQMLPLIGATIAETYLSGSTATPLVAAQWTAWAARLARMGVAGARVAKVGKTVSTIGKSTYNVLLKGAASEITYGVASGSATYNAIADDEEWGNGALGTADKIAYSVWTGLSDYGLARIGKHIFRTSAAEGYASTAYRQGKLLAANSGSRINAQLVKGFALKRGINLGGEALSEAVSNVGQYIIENDAKNKDITFREALDQGIDGAITGATIGAAFDVSGSLFGRGKGTYDTYKSSKGKQKRWDRFKAAINAGNRYDVDLSKNLIYVKEELKGYEQTLKNTKNQTQRDALTLTIEGLKAKIDIIEANNTPFYTMLSARHPEVIEALNEKDAQIEVAAAKYKAAEANSQQQVALRGELKVLLDERGQITSKYKTKDGNYNLTAEEKLSVTEMKIEDAISRQREELNLQEDASKERADRGDSMSEPVKQEGDGLLRMQQQKVEKTNKLKEDYEAAKEALEEADSKGESQENITKLEESLHAAQNGLLVSLGLDEKNGIVVRKSQAKLLDAQERKTQEWLDKSLEELEDSGLTKEEITELLKAKKVTALTAENPMNRDTDNSTNESRNKEAEAWLKSNGLTYHKIIGKYEKGENSFLVEDMTVEQAVAFAKKFDQDSVAMPQGLVNQKGQIQLFGEGVDIDENIGDDFFSAIRDKDGNVIRFAMPLTEKYVDVDGKEITEDQYETVVNKGVEVDETSGEVNSTKIKAHKDGSFRIPEDIPGMTEKSRMFLNIYMPLVQRMYPGIEVVITHDADSVDALEKQLLKEDPKAFKNFNELGGLWYKPAKGAARIYINPTSVEFNSKLEGLERTKTLEETVLEETLHALLGPAIKEMSVDQQNKLLNDLKAIIKNDPALTKRVQEKRDTYLANLGKHREGEVREEEIVEILSAIVADPSSVNMTIISKIRALLNRIMSSLGVKEITINSDSSAIKILHALNNASNLRVEAQAKADSQAKASRRISPYSLKEEGPIKVKYNKTIYKYSKGVKKDIGSTPVEKTFNGKWHFINWWKKSTDAGRNSDVFGFEVDGNEVDIRNLTQSRASARLGGPAKRATEVIDRHNDRIQEAVNQGVITEREAKELNKDWVGRPTNTAKYYERIPAEEMAADPDLQRIYDEKINLLSKLEEKSIRLIESNAKSKGKKFYYGPDEPSAKASSRLNRKLLNPEDLMDAYGEHIEVWDKHLCNIGDKVACNTSKVTPKRLFFSSYIVEEFGIKSEILALGHPRHPDRVNGDLSKEQEAQLADQESRVAKAAAAEYGAIVSKENIEDTESGYGLNGEDPRNFHAKHDEMFDSFIDTLAEDNNYTAQERAILENMKPVFDYIMAITSNGSKALSNNGVTMDLFARISKDVLSGNIDVKNDGFISKAVIDFIGRQQEWITKSREIDLEIHYSGTRGDRKQTIQDQLAKLNEVLTEYTEDGGTIDVERFRTAMSETSSGRFENKSQLTFGSKIGNYALSLIGNMDVLTQDSHVLNTMGTLKGDFLPINNIVQGVTPEKMIAKLAEFGVDVRGKNLPVNKMMDRIKEIKEDDSHPSQKAALKFYKEIKGYRPINDTKWNRSQNERIIKEALSIINNNLEAGQEKVSMAAFGQALYASGRSVFHKDYTSNSRMGAQLLEVDAKGNRKYAKTSLKQDVIDLNYSEERAKHAASGRLTRFSERQLELFDTAPLGSMPRISDAIESSLYRDRDHKEVLNYKGKILNDETELQALNTHATSRKIMEQNNEVNVGDRVGVRLNLNVLSNTGVPVQALHEITSTGNVKNVLKYGTAITIKNPTLFVNQDAREKIATFQDNKFPMASVNGEFVNSKIDEANFSGVKAIFNPHKSNVFTDVAGRPIKSAQEATVIGNNVFLRGDIEYYNFDDPIIMKGRTESVESKKERVKRGKDYEASIRKFELYNKNALGVTYESRAELEMAYDNLSLESKAALDESAYAENLKDLETLSRASGRLRSTLGRMVDTQQGVLSDILNNPSAYITPQNLSKAKDKLENMSIQEITEILNEAALGKLSERNDDISVLAGIELFNRRMKAKDYDGAGALVEELAATGTTVGRMLRHFRELKTSNPEGMALMIKQEVARKNKKLSEEQEKRLSEMSKDLFDLNLEHEELMKRAIAGDDVEAELEAKTKEIKKKERELDTFTNTVIEKGWSEIGKQLIQGNLLTPMSQITNVGANMINAMGKVAVDAIALPIEKMLNLIPGLDSPIKRNYSLNAYVWGVRKFGAGFVESLNEIATGQTKDVTEWRVQRGFAPIRSLLSALGTKKGEALPVNVGGKFREGKTSINHRAKLFVQGTFGIPAETMFRFLSLGDTPFRRGTEGIELYQIGKSKGLKGEALMRFMKYPDKKSRELAEREGRKLTFQERTAASQVAEQSINFLERMLGKGLDAFPFINGKALASFLVRASVPYVRTPANILMDTLTFVSPYVAGARIMGDLKNKDTRSAAQNFGKMMVGSMVTQAAMVLIKEGLISGEVEWDEDEEKNLAYDQFPPNSINISGLKRWLEGNRTEKREDDNFISYNKLGIPGTILGAMVKSADRDEIKARDYSDGKFIYHGVMDSFGVGPFSSISHMMDQSFLQGVNNFMDVLTSTDPDDFGTASERWLATTFKAASAMALPNTLSALHRSERTYMPDMRITKDMDYGERLLKRLEYIVKDRTFGATDIPVRVNWKGDPIKQNPRGNKGWVYQLLDISKLRKGEADPISQEMYRLYERTEAIPEVVGTPGYAAKKKVSVPNLTEKKAKKAIRKAGLEGDLTFLEDEEFMAGGVYLSTKQINQMMKVSGQDRYSAVARMMDTQKYRDASDYEKVEMLNKLNEDYKSAIEYDGKEFRPHTVQLLYMIEQIYRDQYEED